MNDIIKKILNNIFDEYYHNRNKIFDNEYNQNKIHIVLIIFIKNIIYDILIYKENIVF